MTFIKFIFYLDCWNNEPDNRPTINQVIAKLKAVIPKENIEFQPYDSNTNVQSSSEQKNIVEVSNNNLLHGELCEKEKEITKDA